MVEKGLAALDGAVGRVEDADGATMEEEEVEKLVKGRHGHIVSELSSLRVIRIKELGGLVYALGSRLSTWLAGVVLPIFDRTCRNGINTIEEDVSSLGRSIDGN